MNEKGLLLLVVFLMLSLPTFSQQWNATGATWTNGRYDDIYFHSADKGWAVNSDGKIFKTIDGGKNWVELYNDPYRYFRSVEFLNAYIGFAGTLNGVLLKTKDGGKSWVEIQNLIPANIPGICGLSHAGNNVYGTGLFAHPAYFIKSTNQGNTWTYTDMSSFADGLVECHFINENIGFLAGIKENTGGVILKTTDGGDNWTKVLNTQNGSEYIWKLDFVTEQIGYGSIEAFMDNTTNIVKTTDGGDSWTILQVDSIPLDIQGIGFIDENKGWVSPRNSPMYQTTDGGLSWNTSNLYKNINRFFRVNSELMYASGASVYKYDNSFVSTQEVPNFKRSHSISSIKPNPFVHEVYFTVNIYRRTTARIDLYDSRGQHISNFYSGQIDAGEHHFHLNSHDSDRMNSGLYYLVLRSNEGFISKKITKQY